MKIVKEMPSTGQFVRLWEHNGEIWSDVAKNDNSQITYYCRSEDKFLPRSRLDSIPVTDCMGYVVIDNTTPTDYNHVRVNVMRDAINTLAQSLYSDSIEYQIIVTALNIDNCIVESVCNNLTEELNNIRAKILSDVVFNLVNNYFDGEEEKTDLLNVLLDSDNTIKELSSKGNTINLTK